jgi:hypothetical protein
MDRSKEFRKNANACTEIADAQHSEFKKKRFERLAEGWSDLANQQDWLDGELKRKLSLKERPDRPE